ncbi:MAG: DNA polymerase III subunit gamma/tau [Oscillospiraceae bacterium]|nr:DNA polymerase III subunit gamma/tau [Oscillospiraceae bacterium]MDD4413665.1 DNA polymerase III subunit gamma/tau [Oscillospiraceae bacterium]
MYQMLYRKWRPQSFSQVYGQPMITAALKNELKTGRIAHAYLFTGSRGTGKTSCAKILSKAVNCLNPQEGDPCNQCAICHGIDDETVLDVVEIDAASNNGVDNIRDLREEVNFTPAVAKYRVYIIDEVHMLSAGAFNALLKTLEEPPGHVIFVLATTEVHKLPATILSRCQRFDFGRIPPEDISERIKYIAQQEQFTITDEAAFLVARISDGSMRDALSLIDQCLSQGHEMTVDTVAKAAGLAGRDYLFELSSAVRTGDSGAALALIGRLYNASLDMERLCAELIDFYRNLMVIKSVSQPESLIIVPTDELKQLGEEAAAYQLPAILHCMDILQASLESLRSGASRRVGMEMAVLKLCSPELDTDIQSLLRRIKALEVAVKSGNIKVNEQAEEKQLEKLVNKHKKKDEATPPPAVAPADDHDVPEVVETEFTGWNDVITILEDSCPPLFGVLQNSTAVLRGNIVLIDTDNEMFKSLVSRDGNTAKLAEAIKSVSGKQYRIGIMKKPNARVDESNDPLSSFIRASMEMGVNLEVKP